VKTVFKIRDKITGQYSSGGYVPTWGPKGKAWDSLADVRAHLKLLERGSHYYDPMKIPEFWEVIEVRFEETIASAVPAQKLLVDPPPPKT
jgi:hypothetical protein